MRARRVINHHRQRASALASRCSYRYTIFFIFPFCVCFFFGADSYLPRTEFLQRRKSRMGDHLSHGRLVPGALVGAAGMARLAGLVDTVVALVGVAAGFPMQ